MTNRELPRSGLRALMGAGGRGPRRDADPFGMETFVESDERDPFGRLWTDPNDPIPRMRDAFRRKTLFDEAGDALFRLQGGVGAGERNGRVDTAKVETLLERAGLLNLSRAEGPTGFLDDVKLDAIRAAQQNAGLLVDGKIRPGGETLRMLRATLSNAPQTGAQIGQAQQGPQSPPPVPRPKPSSPPATTGSSPAPAAGRTPPALISPVPNLQLRGRDAHGEGRFGASRTGGTRLHKGVDVVASPGTPASSTVDGTVTFIGHAYRNQPYRYVEVTTKDGFVVRHFYVAPASNIRVGSRVKAGTMVFGTVQDLARLYPGITNHIHLRIGDSRQRAAGRGGGFNSFQVIDPTPLLRPRASP